MDYEIKVDHCTFATEISAVRFNEEYMRDLYDADPGVAVTITALGGLDAVAHGRGPAPVSVIHMRAFTESAKFCTRVAEAHAPAAGLPFISIDLGWLSGLQTERVLALLAGSKKLEALYHPVPDGENRAWVQNLAEAESVCDWVRAVADEVRRTGEDAMPPGWQRYRCSEELSVGARYLYTRIWPSNDASGCADFYGKSSPDGALVWPIGEPEKASLCKPEKWLKRLIGLREIAPVPGPTLAAIAWDGGCHNVKLIAEATRTQRETVYRWLRNAGIEPTTR